jgi:hypothetical protein
LLALGIALAALNGCGGSGSNPLGNPPLVVNSAAGAGQTLSFAYFEHCINPIFDAKLSIDLSGVTIVNTCSNAACHNSATGHGGAFRVVPSAQLVDVLNPANTPAVIRGSDIYRNFLSAQGEVIIGAPTQSLLINKPLVRNVLHGGGLIFSSDQDPHIKLMEYWISNPMPAGQDEFSTAGYNLFTPADPDTGACNTN